MNKISVLIKTKFFFLFVLAAVIFVLYGKSINYDYTSHDDTALIKDKILFISDIRNIPELFVTSCFYSGNFQYYRPMLSLSFAVCAVLSGENLKVHHFFNLVLFIFAFYLMYVFCLKICDDTNTDLLKILIVLTAVHPVFTSSAVWLPGRNDTLLAVFIFLSVIFLSDYCKKNIKIYKFYAYLFFVFALLTKESALIAFLPCVIMVIFFNINHKFSVKEIFSDVFILISVITAYFYVRSISVIGAGENLNIMQCLNNFYVWILLFFRQYFFPDLMPVMIYKPELSILNFVFFGIFAAAVSFFFYKNRTLWKKIVFAVIWFVSFLIPVSAFHEPLFLYHRLFVPAAGFIILLYEILKYLSAYRNVYGKYLPFFLYSLILIFFYASYIHKDKFANAYTYWDSAYEYAQTYHVACVFKSYIEFENGNYDKSFGLIKKAMSEKPGLYDSQFAVLLFNNGQYNEAKEYFLTSVGNNIDTALSYRYLSEIFVKEGDYRKASEYAEAAYKANPYNEDIVCYKKKLDSVY